MLGFSSHRELNKVGGKLLQRGLMPSRKRERLRTDQHFVETRELVSRELWMGGEGLECVSVDDENVRLEVSM